MTDYVLEASPSADPYNNTQNNQPDIQPESYIVVVAIATALLCCLLVAATVLRVYYYLNPNRPGDDAYLSETNLAKYGAISTQSTVQDFAASQYVVVRERTVMMGEPAHSSPVGGEKSNGGGSPASMARKPNLTTPAGVGVVGSPPPTAIPRAMAALSGDPGQQHDNSDSQSEASMSVRAFAWSDLTLISRVGGGAFSQVYEAELTNVGSVAVKILTVKDDNFGTLDRIRSEMAKEVKLLCKLQHDNIVHFVGQISEGSRCCIVMELAEHGSLHDLLYVQSKVTYFSKDRKFKILKGIVAGVAYLHQNKIIHRDIKPENVLIAKDYVPKLTDFNVSVERELVSRTMQGTSIGTCLYMAPEMFDTKGKAHYSYQADVYSIALLMVDLFTHTRPFSEYPELNSEYALAEAVKNNVRPELPEDFDHQLEKFMWRCWHMEPRERPTSMQMLKWLNHLY